MKSLKRRKIERTCQKLGHMYGAVYGFRPSYPLSATYGYPVCTGWRYCERCGAKLYTVAEYPLTGNVVAP